MYELSSKAVFSPGQGALGGRAMPVGTTWVSDAVSHLGPKGSVNALVLFNSSGNHLSDHAPPRAMKGCTHQTVFLALSESAQMYGWSNKVKIQYHFEIIGNVIDPGGQMSLIRNTLEKSVQSPLIRL